MKIEKALEFAERLREWGGVSSMNSDGSLFPYNLEEGCRFDECVVTLADAYLSLKGEVSVCQHS